MTRLCRALSLLALATLFVAPANGQTLIRTDQWSHGTTLNVFGGASVADSDTNPMLGGSIGWEVTPGLAVEGSGYWFDQGRDADAFGAALKAQVGFGARPVVPFFSAGIGLYHASFNPAASNIPDFYRNHEAHGAALSSFTDPSFVIGAGLNVFISRHIAIRPDVEATIAMNDSQSFLVTVAAVHLSYHFEDHPITPARRR